MITKMLSLKPLKKANIIFYVFKYFTTFEYSDWTLISKIFISHHIIMSKIVKVRDKLNFVIGYF
jgi:hypothetical protein